MTVGVRPDDLRRRNRAMVIQGVRRLGGPSRTELAAVTALSPSTISAIAADLIAEGVLEERKAAETAAMRRGRPQVGLALNPRAAGVIVLVLQINALSGALVDYGGEVVAERQARIPTQAMDADALVTAIAGMAEALSVDAAARPLRVPRIAVAVQGITDSAARTMVWSPVTSAHHLPIAEALECRFGVPVTVDNDSNMIAEALRWRDPQRYRDDFMAVLLSDGIGMGLFAKGKLFTGARSSGGEFGHMVVRPGGALCRCGRRGCVEAYAGNYAIWRAAQRLDEASEPAGDVEGSRMVALARAAREADGAEREAFRRAGEALGYGLGSLFALFDAAPVAFVGTGATAFDLMEAPLREAIAATAGGKHGLPVTFDVFEDERPLIRLGCAMRALGFVDDQIAAHGAGVASGLTPAPAA